MISVYNNGLTREVCMKKVLLMIAAGLVMTSSAFATGHAAGCPLKNFGNGVSRFDTKSNQYHAAVNKSGLPSRNTGAGKVQAQQ